VNEIKQEMAAEESCAEKPKIETEPDNMEVGEVQPDWQQKFNELQAKMVKLEAEYASITQTLNKVAVSNVADDIKLKNLAGKIEAPPAKELREKQPVRTNRF
jgi:hypothetical protein